MSIWSQHVLAGEAFSAEHFVLGVGGLQAHIQLFNPVGSNVRVRLREVEAVFVVAVVANVRRHDTPLVNLGPFPLFVINRLLDTGVPAAAELRNDSTVAPVGSQFWALNAPANTPAVYPSDGMEWGMDLLEGQGILLQFGTAVTGITNWQWVEVPL